MSFKNLQQGTLITRDVYMALSVSAPDSGLHWN